jgi:predicted nucleic acid-binding protein
MARVVRAGLASEGLTSGHQSISSILVLRLLIDTSVWLDLAKRRDGQKLIHAIGQVTLDGDVELLVPTLVQTEFDRNRERIERTMTASVADRFKTLRSDLEGLTAESHAEALAALTSLAYEMPLVGAMATRNFTDIQQLLDDGTQLDESDAERSRVVNRALRKKAPCHLNKNSIADGLLVELYATTTAEATITDSDDRYAFVTSNHQDFSVAHGDQRLPHPDIADLFHERSRYYVRTEGLQQALSEYFGEEFDQILEESDFQENPRTLAEILDAEREYFERVWFDRSMDYTDRWEAGEREERATEESYAVSVQAQERFRVARPDLRPAESGYELGMWSGKLSALRWVLGSEWDFLDT